ncbi:enoyl-CoA hydratase family protein [Brevundimonas sp.]|uniref:enoyl-CoA hydratase family protein n=1 Tax=Brevundimonas sp. TaxID=1871086 RepID=UPI003D6D83EF
MPILVEIRDRVAEIILDHPPVNALDSDGWMALPEHIAAAGADPEVRCVLIRATGRGFCGGVDIKEMQAHPERITRLNQGNYLTLKAIVECPVPVVSAIHGFAIGGGVNIAGASDVVIAAEGAFLSLPEIDRGAMGGASFLSRMAPPQRVRSAFFTGGKITVEELLGYGSVHAVVPPERLLEAAREFCAVIAAKSRKALVIAKEALNGLEARDALKGYRWEQGFTLEMYMHEDSQTARDAFVVDKGQAAKF